MSIIDFDWPPSWSLDTSKSGESTISSALPLHAIKPTASIHRHFVLSAVSLPSRDQDGDPMERNDLHLKSRKKYEEPSKITCNPGKKICFSFASVTML